VAEDLLPPNVREYIYTSGPEVTWHMPGTEDRYCEGAKHHSPRPLTVDDTYLVLRRWWPEDYPTAVWAMAPKAYLCGTCQNNLTILLQMLHHADGDLSWEIRREFGNDIRGLARRGWEWFETKRPAQSAPAPTKG
jgi:hypothetical protein